MTDIQNTATIVCHHCDASLTIGVLQVDHQAQCPVCGSVLKRSYAKNGQFIIALSIASLIFGLIALLLPFLTMSVYGNAQSFSLLDTSVILLGYQHYLFSSLFFITIILLPAILNIALIILYSKRYKSGHERAIKVLLRFIKFGETWVMADIFLVAVLVSMVKVMAMADVTFGFGFWSFSLFVIGSITVRVRANVNELWDLHVPVVSLEIPATVSRAIDAKLTDCKCCGILSYEADACRRCGAPVRLRSTQMLQVVLAWAMTSLCFYFPANVLPIMYTEQFQDSQASTILEGVFVLWEMSSYPVATIIFFASIVLPLIKILALVYLCYFVAYNNTRTPKEAFYVYKIIEFFGKWSMIDVFVIAVLVALVQFHGFAVISPGEGVIFFAAMVISSMLGSRAFEAKMIWDKQ